MQALISKVREEAMRRRLRDEASRVPLGDPLAASRIRCKSLHTFVREGWHVLEPETRFVDGWVIKAICDHLEAVTRGEITRLLINVPPGFSKSLIVSVFWPAWEWGPMGMPHLRYLTSSFDYKANVVRDNNKMRKLVTSDWYQERWGDLVTLTKETEGKFENTATGGREGRAFSGLTGGRGDRLVIDDPHSTEGAESDADRGKAIRIFRESSSDRLNDMVRSAIVIIMQRLNENDVSGTILKLGLPYVHLCLPMEFEIERRCQTSIGFVDPRKHDGELLFPERFPREAVEALKLVKGSFAYAGQYQQRPTAREGGMFKRHWFKVVPAAPASFEKRVRGWDLAASIPEPNTDPSWTVGARISQFEGKFYVEDVIRFRDSANKVREAIKNAASQDGKRTNITIPKDPGQAGKAQSESIISDLAGYRATAEPQSGDKATRAEPFAVQCEAGNVLLVEGPWNDAYIDELCAFGGGGHNDQVDASASAFNGLVTARGPIRVSDEFLQMAKQRTARR